MQIKPLTDAKQEPEQTPPLEPRLEVEQTREGLAGAEQLEPEAPLAGDSWDQTLEQEWSEHSATAWALAHVIHRIRSTPLPPILTPEQRRHFHKVVHMAAALMEEWQRRERDQAQQLVAGRPIAEPAGEAPIPDGRYTETRRADGAQTKREQL